MDIHGIHGSVLNWFKAFLSQCTQVVKVNGEISIPAAVSSGIPQGNVLGSIIFVLYINDLPDGISSNISPFADDTKIYSKLVNEEGSKVQQNDLEYLNEWSRKWLLNFNTDKCFVLRQI